jgi:hypothetical protein
MAAWQREQARLAGAGARPLPPTGYRRARLRVDQGRCQVTISPICSVVQLVIEGKVLHHCIASYIHEIRARLSAVFSLRVDGKRTLTIEVHPHTQQIADVRGRFNRPPTDEERAWIRIWASNNGLRGA